jgi:hypothetical protein
MKCWLMIAVFSFLTQLQAFIPQEEELHKGALSNGIATWVRINPTPGHMASIRVVWTKGGIPVSHGLDCPSSDTEDFIAFFDDCKEKMDGSFEKAAVIAVGDFVLQDMVKLIETHFNSLEKDSSSSLSQSIVIQRLPELESSTVVLAYPASLDSFQSLDDLEKLWGLYFFQGLVQGRFEQAMKWVKGGDVHWVSPEQGSHFFLPQKVCMAQAQLNKAHRCVEILGDFLLAMKNIYEEGGFNEKEFTTFKSKIQKHLLSVNHKIVASSVLASYYADWFVFDRGCPAYSFFVPHSLEILQNLTLDDVHKLFKTSIKDDARLVEMTIPSGYDLKEAAIQEELNLHRTDMLAGNIKEQSSTPINAVNLYAGLPITQEEADTIYKIVDIVATTFAPKLLFKQDDLKKKGKVVQAVHPLKFMGTIFGNPHLKKCLREIEDSPFPQKWDGFMYGPSGDDGLANSLDLQTDKNNMLPYLPGFCQAVNANIDHVRAYVQKRDWEGLVRYLLN